MTHLSRIAVREIDRRAIEEFGLPGIVLMENAGRGAAERIHATAIEAINEVRRASDACRACAIDLPSGLDCDTGRAAGACVRAGAGHW